MLRNFLSNQKSTKLIIMAILLAGILLCYSVGSLAYKSMQSTSHRKSDATLAEENIILRSLPYKTPYYSISYNTSDSQQITLQVFSESPRFRYVALQQILKFDQEAIQKYPIQFVDFKNPLTQGKDS
jgi:hypothetical protein